MPRHKNLVLAHLWLAFGVFAVATVFGVWQMWVRSPLHAPYREPTELFPLGDRARRVDGLCFDDVLCHGLRLLRRRNRSKASTPLGRGCLDRLLGRSGRRRYGGVDDPLGRRLGALHLLPATDRQSVLLHRPSHGRGRLVDLVRDHDCGDGAMEARQSRASGPARNVCHGRKCDHVVVDHRGCRGTSCCSR